MAMGLFEPISLALRCRCYESSRISFESLRRAIRIARFCSRLSNLRNPRIQCIGVHQKVFLRHLIQHYRIWLELFSPVTETLAASGSRPVNCSDQVSGRLRLVFSSPRGLHFAPRVGLPPNSALPERHSRYSRLDGCVWRKNQENVIRISVTRVFCGLSAFSRGSPLVGAQHLPACSPEHLGDLSGCCATTGGRR